MIKKQSESGCVKLFGVILDNKLNFKKYVECLYKDASRKVKALANISPYTSLTKTHAF